MDIRRIEPGDHARLSGFFRRVPEGDRTFFKEDVLDDALIEAWTTDRRNRRQLAISPAGEVVGYLAVLPGVGWSAHVGELRVVVDPAQRGRGLGRTLARTGLLEALDLGLAKVVVEVIADQAAPIDMFQGLGFEPEALLKDHVRDREGQLRDLVMLAHVVEAAWSAMATIGVDEAVSET
jgi:ribosomal protein S18 acetylase RimI-like enzyme